MKGGIQPHRKLPPDEEIMQTILAEPTTSNQELAERWGVSRERVRQKRKALGLPNVTQMTKARKLMERARQEEFGTQSCIICGKPMKRWRIDRQWVTCGTKCSKRWRRLPGPIRKQRRDAYLNAKQYTE